MSLAQVQREFVARLRDDAGTTNVHGDATFLRGFAVYHHAFRASLRESLRDVFEQTHGWLGDERFEAAMATHIEANAPRSWTISAYGEGFEATLARLYPDNPEVAELAWLEWTLRRAFDGPDHAPLDLSCAAELDWERVSLKMVPTLIVRPVTTSCAEIWSALSQGEQPARAVALPAGSWLAVWRDELVPRFRVIGALEQEALQMAVEGRSFGELCAGLAERLDAPEEAAGTAGSMLQSWIGDGMIAALIEGDQA